MLSARSPQALRDQAAALADRITDEPDLSPADVSWSLATTRAVLDHRAIVIAEANDQFTEGLHALAAGVDHPAVVAPGVADSGVSGKTVWLFSGQGSQRPGMGAELHARFPVFAAAFDEVCGLLNPHLEHPLEKVVLGDQPDLIHHTTYAQTGLFALQVSLARLLDSMGVTPDTVIGHSVGEIAAAHIAGVLDLPDACHLIASRATLMGNLPTGTGTMTAIEATPEELEADLTSVDGQVSIAALNTPTSTVISGPTKLVDTIAANWQERGRRTKALTVSHAFHSAQMDPILDQFTEAISALTYHQPHIPLISNLTGQPADHNITTPTYWTQHIRQPVQFHPAVTHIAARTGIYLEIGPEPVLLSAVQHTLDATETTTTPQLVPTLTHKQPDTQALAHTLARLHTTTPVNWTPWYPQQSQPKTVDLPTYAFQRDRYWIAPASAATASTTGHPHLTTATHTPDGTLHHTGLLPTTTHNNWLTQHTINNTTLLPGTALLQWALHTADHTNTTLTELLLQHPLTLSPTHKTQLHLTTTPTDTNNQRTLTIHTRPHNPNNTDTNGEWTCHATATLTPHTNQPHPTPDTTPWPPTDAKPVDTTSFYETAAQHGYHYGPTYQALHTMWTHDNQLLADITLPTTDTTEDNNTHTLTIHPALLDAALHPLIHNALTNPTTDAQGRPTNEIWLPYAWTDTTLHATGATHARVRITPDETDADSREQQHHLTLTDTTGNLILTTTLTTRPIAAEQLRAARRQDVDGLFSMRWTALPDTQEEPSDTADDWAVLGDGVPEAVSAEGEDEAVSGPRRYADVAALVTALDGGAPVPSVVLTGAAQADGEETAEAGPAALADVLLTAQEWLAEPRLVDARLAIVTRDAVALEDGVPGADGSRVDPVAAGVWGLVRSAQAENPDRFLLLDLAGRTGGAGTLPDARGADPIGVLRTAVAEGESQVAVRGDRVLVPRLVNADESAGIAAPVGVPAWRLVMAEGATGTVDGIVPEECPQVLEPLAAGQVRIAVHAAGINFRDVMVSLGLVPDQRGLGGEGAGCGAGGRAGRHDARPRRPGHGPVRGVLRSDRGGRPAGGGGDAAGAELPAGRGTAHRVPDGVVRSGGPGGPAGR